jgi:hypothetical protein
MSLAMLLLLAETVRVNLGDRASCRTNKWLFAPHRWAARRAGNHYRDTATCARWRADAHGF